MSEREQGKPKLRTRAQLVREGKVKSPERVEIELKARETRQVEKELAAWRSENPGYTSPAGKERSEEFEAQHLEAKARAAERNRLLEKAIHSVGARHRVALAKFNELQQEEARARTTTVSETSQPGKSSSTTSATKVPLQLNPPGRLELPKAVESGGVRQTFSRGRSKAVTVEVKRIRDYIEGELPKPRVEQGEASLDAFLKVQKDSLSYIFHRAWSAYKAELIKDWNDAPVKPTVPTSKAATIEVRIRLTDEQMARLEGLKATYAATLGRKGVSRSRLIARALTLLEAHVEEVGGDRDMVDVEKIKLGGEG